MHLTPIQMKKGTTANAVNCFHLAPRPIITPVSDGYGYIGLGSNLGDPEAQIERALRHLDEQSVRVEEVSSLYRTEPVDAPTELWFLNGVARVSCDFGPRELLAICQEIESSQGRERTIHHGPRTIDLDLLLLGDALMDSPELTLPHPELHLRRFVLVPLAEIAPELIHPILGSTMKELLGWCPDTSAVIRVGPLVTR
jgi:2-amino-4-hydroxy-6-hydroxymethyldihydropteridine diphosphokinase